LIPKVISKNSVFKLSTQNDSNDNTINSDSFTKDNTNSLFSLQILDYLIRFFDLILGDLTAAPTRLEPVIKMPLWRD